MLYRIMIIATGLLLSGLFSVQAVLAQDMSSREFFSMDTYMTLQAWGEEAAQALDEAEAEVKRLELLLDAQDENSEVAALNAKGKASVSEDTVYLIRRAQELSWKTDGAFDITVYPLMKAWGFPTREFRIPEQAELEALLPLVDPFLIELSSPNEVAFLRPGMEIELGAIAKGYASQRIMAIFAAHNVQGVVSLGGNVQTLGKKPDGQPFRVGIRMPSPGDEKSGVMWLPADDPDIKAAMDAGLLGVLESSGDAVITSGLYERYFVKDGTLYHHILDPETGCPARSDLVSVTIVCDDGTTADAYATALFVMGREKAEEFWRGNKDFDMILLDAEGHLIITPGLEERFQSPMTCSVVE